MPVCSWAVKWTGSLSWYAGIRNDAKYRSSQEKCNESSRIAEKEKWWNGVKVYVLFYPTGYFKWRTCEYMASFLVWKHSFGIKRCITYRMDLFGFLPIKDLTKKDCILVGGLWMCLTVFFEFGLGLSVLVLLGKKCQTHIILWQEKCCGIGAIEYFVFTDVLYIKNFKNKMTDNQKNHLLKNPNVGSQTEQDLIAMGIPLSHHWKERKQRICMRRNAVCVGVR